MVTTFVAAVSAAQWLRVAPPRLCFGLFTTFERHSSLCDMRHAGRGEEKGFGLLQRSATYALSKKV